MTVAVSVTAGYKKLNKGYKRIQKAPSCAPRSEKDTKSARKDTKSYILHRRPGGHGPAVTLYNPHNTAVVEHKGLSDAAVSYLVQVFDYAAWFTSDDFGRLSDTCRTLQKCAFPATGTGSFIPLTSGSTH